MWELGLSMENLEVSLWCVPYEESLAYQGAGLKFLVYAKGKRGRQTVPKEAHVDTYSDGETIIF